MTGKSEVVIDETRLDDLRLAKGCLKGDPAAVRDLVEKYQADVYGLCVRMMQDRHEAEDVAQEVFVRVFRHMRHWDRSKALRPWIMGITANRCRTFLAKRAKRPELVEYMHDTIEAPAADDSGELVSEVNLAVDELRPEYRSVFSMYHEHGLPYESIAESLSCPVGTVKTWLHRARAEVMDRLRKRGMVPEVGYEMS